MLILASGSPRRAKILRDLGVEFEVVKSDAEEVAYPSDPERTVLENALAKGAYVQPSTFNLQPSAILSADTIVWFDNKIYGKPKDLEEAKEFLRTLSGKTHVVFTGVALRDGSRREGTADNFEGARREGTADNFEGACREGTADNFEGARTAVVKSEVKFRELSEAMIDEYVARVRPTDRAGAYDIDESGDLIVESYSGSYENIMGLPIEPLRDWGIA